MSFGVCFGGLALGFCEVSLSGVYCLDFGCILKSV